MQERLLKVEKSVNLFYILVFLYFFTLSADLLSIKVVLYKVKLNHLISLSLFVYLAAARKLFFIPRQILTSFLLILTSLLASLFFSVYLERSAGYVLIYFFNFLAYFLVPFNLIYQFDHQKIIRLYASSFVCVGAYALLQLTLSSLGVIDPFAVQSIGTLTRPNGFSYEPSYYALYMCAIVMFYNALHILGEKIKFSFLLLLNALLLISTSTGAFLGYFAFFFLSLFFQLKKKVLQVAASFSLFFILLFLCFPSIAKTYFLKFFYFGLFSHHSFVERWFGLVNAVKVFWQNPVFGVGVGGVGPYLYLEKEGAYASTLQEVERYDPTNVFTEVLASLGVFGLLCFAFLGYQFFKAFKRFKNSELSPEIKRVGTALFLSLATTLIVLQCSQGLFRSYIWVQAAITLAYLNKPQK